MGNMVHGSQGLCIENNLIEMVLGAGRIVWEINNTFTVK